MATNDTLRDIFVDEAIIDDFTMFSIYMADAERRYQERVMRHGNQGQGKALSLLGAMGKMTQTELGQRLHVTPASASELIGKLVQRGLIHRERSTRDGRVMMIALSDQGQTELQEHRDFYASILVNLTEEERTQFASFIRKLVSSVKLQYSL